MQKFNCKYKDASGRSVSRTVEAASLGDAMAILKKDGVSQFEIVADKSITSCGLGRSKASEAFLIIIAIIVCAIAVCSFLRKKRVPESTPEVAATPALEETVVAQVPSEPPVASGAPARNRPVPPTPDPIPTARIVYSSEPEQMVQEVEVPQLPAEPEPVASKRKVAQPPLIETIISMIGQPGEDMPPAPFSENDPSLDVKLQEALDHVIEILEEDDAATQEKKLYLAWIKDYMKEEMENGGRSAGEFLKDLEAFRQEEARFKKQCQAQYNEAYKTLSPEDAEAVREELNALLSEHGLPEIESVSDRRERLRKRREEAKLRKTALE